ncbi:hypothetical protein J3Q64DRAFT_1439231 [Phycomyces blakesleeanus]|uniref:DNA polymerase kappa n=1 Tax=Phycomyces blakesleeanus TaxID=4837 RepID=A0ABR3B5G9_PHYBL
MSSQVIEEQDLFLDDDTNFPEQTSFWWPAETTTKPVNDGVIDSLRTQLAGPSTGKAGLANIDKEKVNAIIYEASKGSAYFENERRKDKTVTKRIETMLIEASKVREMDLSMETRIVDGMIREFEESRDLSQTICHVDMDAFYASVEELDAPEWKNKPMAVGSNAMLSTSNYIARTFGVRSAMPGFIALKLCPDLCILPHNFKKYQAASDKVRAVFAKYDPDFSPMSLDEAYLNLTKVSLKERLETNSMTASELVQTIREEIFQSTQLTASAGIGPNKLLAKICSDFQKPNGQFEVSNDREAVQKFMAALPIRKIFGVGRVTERVLDSLGVKMCSDIYAHRALLYKLLSPISFKFMLRSYLGLGSTVVKAETTRKSISVERTFDALSAVGDLILKVEELAVLLAKDLADAGIKGKTIGIKLKLSSFELRVRSKTMPFYISSAEDIARIAGELLFKEMPVSLRLMGIRMSSLQPLVNENGLKKYFSAKIPNKQSIEDEEDMTPYIPEDYPMEAELSEEGDIENKSSLTCPICNRCLQLDNLEFNQHVDGCLSKIEVGLLL